LGFEEGLEDETGNDRGRPKGRGEGEEVSFELEVHERELSWWER